MSIYKDERGRGPAEAGRRPPAGLSLDTRTQRNDTLRARLGEFAPLIEFEPPEGPHVAVVLYDHGKGLVDGTAIQREGPPMRWTRRRETKHAVRTEMEGEDLKRSICRTKRDLRHRVLALGEQPYLWTLTKRYGFDTREEARQAWVRFCRLMHDIDKTFAAVAVAEPHTGQGVNHGKWHIHFVVGKWLWVQKVRLCWHRALGEKGVVFGEGSPGNVDVQTQNRGRAKVARYLAKYIGKAIQFERVGEKRYWVTGVIGEPAVERFYLPLGDDTQYRLEKIVRRITGKPARARCLRHESLIGWCVATY